mmetsp:Transcript_7658/g.11596  ORF Transcript_7658/g.11596 Transcript_7658/m.11596 type:complete len:359 (-) Transcript_7658:71-1147(-)
MAGDLKLMVKGGSRIMSKDDDKAKKVQPTFVQKITALCFLVVQIVVTVTMLRYSRISSEGKPYLSSSVVVLSEYLKVFLATCLVMKESGSFSAARKEIYTQVWLKKRECLKMAIPATLYAIQNNLLFIALSNLDSAVYQITYQIKTVTTALFAVLILKKDITSMQWLAIVMLAIGVSIVQLGVHSKASTTTTESSDSEGTEQNPVKGILAILAACMTSGFAGIYFEKVLKQTKQSVWMRNIQLGLFGGFASIIVMLCNDWNDIKTLGFFHNYNLTVVFVVCLQASTGLIVAVVVKYTDNIIKAFAGALAIIGASLASIVLFEFEADTNFLFGGIIVVVASYTYGTTGRKKKKLKKATR